MENIIVEHIIKDYKLPIPLVPNNYEYYFELFENNLHTNSLYELACKEIGAAGSYEKWRQNLHSTEDIIIATIQETEAYKRFNSENNEDFFASNGKAKFQQKTCEYDFTKNTDVYTQNNDGKKFVSIDIEKANFQVLKTYDKDIVLGADSYHELMKKFTNSDYIIGSKYIRQIIFGNLSPKRQNTIEKYYIGKILTFLIDSGLMSKDKIRVITHDELVFDTDVYLTEEKMKEIYDEIYHNIGIKTHVESYTIRNIHGPSYVKELSTGDIAFKCVPTQYFPQVYKKYFGLDIIRRDLAFVYEKELAYFSKSIEGKEL